MREEACTSGSTARAIAERPAEPALAQVIDQGRSAAGPLLDDGVHPRVHRAGQVLPRAVVEIGARVRQAIGMLPREVRLRDRRKRFEQVALELVAGAGPGVSRLFGGFRAVEDAAPAGALAKQVDGLAMSDRAQKTLRVARPLGPR